MSVVLYLLGGALTLCVSARRIPNAYSIDEDGAGMEPIAVFMAWPLFIFVFTLVRVVKLFRSFTEWYSPTNQEDDK